MFYLCNYSSPIGLITLASQHNKLVGAWIEGEKYFAHTINTKTEEKPNLAIFNSTKKWLDDYFSGKRPNPYQLELAPNGTPFRQLVWEVLYKIPYGEVITYGDIAKQIALKTNKTSMSSQAVGGAVGHNPISIIIPCHRVIGANGNLTGYAGGIDKKIQLLQHEEVNTTQLIIPTKGTAL
ncbi:MULTISPECIES: methylated-DNA--[protein]-cysteine S-methyltransferase [unclassified Gilliamella]|uniref:methylated-DNA--[protein]-cysteine S-methyltransferase n=1 Tax=unclassified Gilliamella TaxID=2685620 RepID=UPI001308865F|nr:MULTISPECIES: methylated-DNA--[protein]-cysteine S-methyltransferase [unclassified Gilliamella]MWP49496.1 methylated-DNA--[protein]-cysteine S-methyltransferase [Gilliamella sp. Lep-s35]MWP69224.1 methylated-DNA--[protein]-cysteine S-methyltransferase [Gilliamella sp. Lep-s5]MWP77487.1 methylated-DNA--[protein]-cysteine S-methyltransferase [Gilliamella sp. Lep-s21]